LADTVTPKVRSRMMASIRGKDTKPEMVLRRGLHALGFRYRLHDRALPGRPDLVFPARRGVIFANGCFWHGHGCNLFRWPGTREEFWREKIGANIERDRAVRERLLGLEWRVADVWECALRGPGRLPIDRVLADCSDFLRGVGSHIDIVGLVTGAPAVSPGFNERTWGRKR
jgi:DNA mismatch endonuclease (patch repair protein)